MYNQEYYELGAAPSSIRALFAYGQEKAKELGPENVFDYSLGNPSIPAPEAVNANIRAILEDTESIKVHGYTVAQGTEKLRSAVAADLAERTGLNIKGSELFFTCGTSGAIVATVKALCAGEKPEIMLIAPFFPEYITFTKYNGAKPVIVPADTEKFQINLRLVEEMISPDTQAIIINSPNNPTGVVYTEETLRSLADILTRKSAEYGHPIYIISDEPYRELVYGGVKVPFIPKIYKNTIVCYAYSKSYSLPGERLGYVYVPEFAEDSSEIFNAVAGASRVIGHVCPPSLMQMVIERCPSEKPDLKAYDENRTLLYSALTEMGYECAKPDGAFYLFVKVPGGDAKAYSKKAKLEHNLLVVPGDAFRCPGYMRLSYCVSNEMIKRSLPAFKAMING